LRAERLSFHGKERSPGEAMAANRLLAVVLIIKRMINIYSSKDFFSSGKGLRNQSSKIFSARAEALFE